MTYRPTRDCASYSGRCGMYQNCPCPCPIAQNLMDDVEPLFTEEELASMLRESEWEEVTMEDLGFSFDKGFVPFENES